MMLKRLFTLLTAAPLILGGTTGAARATPATADCGALVPAPVAGATTTTSPSFCNSKRRARRPGA